MNLENDFKQLQKKLIKIEQIGEREIAKNYKRTLDEVRSSIASLYEKYDVNGQLTLFEMNKYNRLAKLDKEVMRMVSEMYKGNTQVIRGVLRGVVDDTYSNSLGIVNRATGIKLKGMQKSIDITKTVNGDMAGLNWVERMGHHRNTAIYDIQKEIKQGLSNGDTYSTMAKRLKDKLEVDITKATTIVQTESHRCQAQAKEDSFDYIEKAGVVFREQWVSSRDESVRNAHSELDGTIIERGDDFHSSNGGVGPGPGLMNNASDDIRCRCLKILVLD